MAGFILPPVGGRDFVCQKYTVVRVIAHYFRVSRKYIEYIQ